MKPSKNPRGGAGLLFMTGLGLEVLVGAVAARAYIAEAGTDFLSDLPALPRKETAMVEPARAVADPGVPQSDPGEALAAAGALCASLIAPEDYGAIVLMNLSVGADGRVVGADAVGASRALTACLEAEAEQWALPATGQPIQLWRTWTVE